MNEKKSTQPILIRDFKNQLKSLRYNPASIQRAALDVLRQAHEGEMEVVDVDTPFGFALSIAAVTTSAAIDEMVALNRKQYPIAAQTEDEIYLHMSDRDYLNRFALPSKAKFTFVFDKEELLSRMVEDLDLGVKRLIIPRNTKIQVNELVFTMLYPIEIRQLRHGGIQVLYDNNIPSPFQVLESNIIDYQTYTNEGIEWLSLSVDVKQLHIRTLFSDVDLISTVDEDIILEDEYYALRAYIKRNDKWEEIKTTHTEQIYDPNILTAVLKVKQGQVNVKIPQIYMSRGLLNGNLRFDLYETRADIVTDLSVYPTELFEVTFTPDAFHPESTPYSAPLKNFKTLYVMSDSITEGGNRPMTVEELRNNAVNNSVGLQVVPITPSQISTSLNRAGYDIVRNIDNVVNRTYLATKPMPLPTHPDLTTAASASIETFLFTEAEVSALKSVKKNFRSVTITPDTLFENSRGVMKLVPDARVDVLKSQASEVIAADVTNNSYLYTPFHYVMDFGLDEFNVRPYYLDKPVALYKSFVSDNDRTLLQVSVNEFEIERVEGGYRLVVSVKSSQEFKDLADDEVFIQLAFKPKGEDVYAYLNGKLEGYNNEDERVFSFDLSTSFYINRSDEMELTRFRMYNLDDRRVVSALENDFEVLFSTTRRMPKTWREDDVDKRLGRFLLPAEIYGISNDRVRVRFGYSLHNLWARARSVITSNDYARYQTDKPLVYKEDIYEIDPATGSSVTVSGDNVQYRIKHAKGSPVMYEGKPVMEYRRGDVILDALGKPTFDNVYGLARQVDIMMIEGAYWFATDDITIDYRQEIVDTLVSWIHDGLKDISKSLLEQTRIFFYPKSTVGPIEVMVNNSVRTIIESGQRFVVKLFVSNIVHGNHELRKELKAATVRILAESLKGEVVSNSAITEELREAYGNDVIAFSLEGLGGRTDVETITVLNDAKRLSLRKRLVAQGDGSLFVEEDVTCEFLRHDKKELL